MPRKKTINLAIPVPLLNEFNEVCKHYGHAKQKGLVLSAAILMFLEADPADQGEALERILVADVRSGVDELIERAKTEQIRRIEARQQQGSQPDDETETYSPLRIAAKRAGDSKRSIKRLPQEPEE